MEQIEKIFKIRENHTTVKTEIIAGLTTFMTMAYIIALNPNLLTGFGAEGQNLWNGVFLATCIASFIGMMVMAFVANKPFAMAPGMGLNSFFAVVVANIVGMTGMSYLESFQSALCIILLEGIIFIILSVLNIRDKIVNAIPLGCSSWYLPGNRSYAFKYRCWFQRWYLFREWRTILCNERFFWCVDTECCSGCNGKRLHPDGSDSSNYVYRFICYHRSGTEGCKGSCNFVGLEGASFVPFFSICYF